MRPSEIHVKQKERVQALLSAILYATEAAKIDDKQAIQAEMPDQDPYFVEATTTHWISGLRCALIAWSGLTGRGQMHIFFDPATGLVNDTTEFDADGQEIGGKLNVDHQRAEDEAIFIPWLTKVVQTRHWRTIKSSDERELFHQ